MLEYVSKWLEIAREEGVFNAETVFVHKDGSAIPAHIHITPTFKNGEQIGYCGVTEVLEDTPPLQVPILG